jgi:hypothetical protein
MPTPHRTVPATYGLVTETSLWTQSQKRQRINDCDPLVQRDAPPTPGRALPGARSSARRSSVLDNNQDTARRERRRTYLHDGQIEEG